jgi:hypothetical protein
MSKRKSAAASKQARNPKIAAKAHRAAQAVVRSTKPRPRLVAAGSGKSSPKLPNGSKPVAPVGKPVTSVGIENPVTALPEAIKLTMMESSLSKRYAVSSATSNLRTYQAMLLEMAQANMTFAFEFNQRLATIRSPYELFMVIGEFTGRRIAMIGKYSREMGELGMAGKA